MDITIIGDGVFGSFLKKELASHCNIITNNADIAILAIPFSEYEAYAMRLRNRHMVNVCSVQEETNKFCLAYSKRVTGIHPMFGPRSPKEGRTCVITETCNESPVIISLFEKIGASMYYTSAEQHDCWMGMTHKQVIRIAELVQGIVENARGVPDACLPTSFKKLKEMSEQFLDMSPGTLASIKANKF